MKTLQKTLIIAAALASTAAIVPALANAQPAAVIRVDYGRGWDHRGGQEINSRIDRIQDRINMGQSTRRISRMEAARLNQQLGSIIATKRTYERTGRGLDGRETAMLNDRLDRLSADTRLQAHDGNRW